MSVKNSTAVDEKLILDPEARLRHLAEMGSSVEVNKDIPITRYLRSGPQMEKMARTYYAEGQWEQALILYNKFATLYVEKLPKHPGYSKAPPADKSRVKKLIGPALDQALELKKKLKQKYEQEKEIYSQQIAEREEAKRKRKQEEEKKKRETEEILQKQKANEIEAFLTAAGTAVPVPERPPPSTSTAQPTSNTHTVVQSDTSHVTEDRPPPYSSEPERSRDEPKSTIVSEPEFIGTLPVIEVVNEDDDDDSMVEDSWAARDDMLLLSNNRPYLDDDESFDDTNSEPIEGVTEMGVPAEVVGVVVQAGVSSDHVSLNASDVGLSKVLPDTFQSNGPLPIASMQGSTPVVSAIFQQTPPTAPPPYQGQYYPPPPGPYQAPPPGLYQAPPPAPYYVPPPGVYQAPPMQGYYQAPPRPVQTPPTAPPTYQTLPPVNRDVKPSLLSSLGGINGIRPMFIPGDTPSKFQQVASSNTRKNIETCGILAGKLANNTLCITHIIIPKQRGKADSCETENEEELFDVQDKHDLITLGWIHTHPSQTAFMSSVDLHTHYSYQVMLDEAIAIVVAPSKGTVGHFTLTQPHGVNYISKCSGKGFHTHPKEPPLYEECKHIHYDNSLHVLLIDLR